MAWRMKGEYLKNCNCIATCPCDTMGVPYPDKGCEGVVGMRIAEGHFDGVPLDGITWLAVFHWPGALHEGNGTVQPYLSDHATPEQLQALGAILTGQAGGPFFEILAQIVTTVRDPKIARIEWEFNQDARRAKIRVDGEIETTVEPLTVPATGDEQRVRVSMPGGFEYKEMEVALSKTLESDLPGPLSFKHAGTHSSLATVDHTGEGLVA
jgi:hypothetical protein